MKGKQQEALINKTMQSLDGIKRAEPSPYLFTRIQSAIRQNNAEQSVWGKIGSFISQPGVAFTGMVLLLGFNLILLINQQRESRLLQDQLYITESKDEALADLTAIYDNENSEP